MTTLEAFNHRHLPDLPPVYPGIENDAFLKPEDIVHDPNQLRLVATTPRANTPWPSELPPLYSPVDPLAHSFTVDGDLIYATGTSQTPRYQLHQDFTRSGRPSKLNIRRLTPSETRRGSLPTSHLSPKKIYYDDEATMYTMTSYEMRGLRSSTISGRITFETGSGIRGKWSKIYQLTKNTSRDSLNPENEARIQKYGYHAADEWNKRLLYVVKKGKWCDGDGRLVAGEENGGFRIEEGKMELTGPRRDLLVAAWAYRLWMCEGIRWDRDGGRPG